jgi:hypothetical protein
MVILPRPRSGLRGNGPFAKFRYSMRGRGSDFETGEVAYKTFRVQIHKTKQTRHLKTLIFGIATSTDIHESINTIHNRSKRTIEEL